MKVGCIGLGQMGSAIAVNLVKAGHDVTVHNRSPEKCRPLVELGAHAASSVADACKGEVVLTMLADDHAVHDVVLAPGGIIEQLAKNAVHVSMSTISVALSEQLAQAHAKGGQRFVSAPVFGRPEAAAAAKLTVVAAGEAAAVKDCQPLFEAIGQKIFNLGTQPPAANLVKLSGNFVIASAIETLGEAIALVAKGGVDRKAFVDVLTSTLFPSPVYQGYGGLIAARKYEPAGFTAALGLKDVRLGLAAADKLQVPMPIASLVRDHFLRVVANGGENLDWGAVGDLATQDSGQATPHQRG